MADVSITFLGDVAPIVTRAETGDIAPPLNLIISSGDLAVANLEGTMYAGAVNAVKNPRVFLDDAAPAWLASQGVRLVSLANNHVFDGLRPGFERMRTALDGAGILRLGADTGPDACACPLRWECNGVSFGFLAYAAYDTNPNVPGGGGMHLNCYEHERACADVERLRGTADHVIVQYHGGKDFSHYPHPVLRSRLRELVDRGAALVVGHHPHVRQGWERYGRGYIFYSLGNFLFDDIVNGGRVHRWTAGERRSIIVRTRWSRHELADVAVVPVRQQGTRVVPDRGTGREYCLFWASTRGTWWLNAFYVDYLRRWYLVFFRPGKRPFRRLLEKCGVRTGRSIR